MKYCKWLNEWLECYVKHSSKQKTYIRYSEIIKQHINKDLGNYDISEITPLIIQQFIVNLLEKGNIKTGKGLSVNSVNGIITVIQSSLKVAYYTGLSVEYNADRIKRPKPNERKISCLTLSEQKKIENAVINGNKPKMLGIVLCLYTGLRLGELLALEWSDIDMKKCIISISKSCYDGKDINGKFIRITDTPKTFSSKRNIPFPKQLIPFLVKMKRYSNSIYVIASNNNKPVQVRAYQRSFELLLQRLCIPHKGFHSLRHTFATRALECGMDIKTLSEILGHRNPSITLKRYVHSLLDHKINMMNKVGKLLK